jgi:hypothetical protein
MFPLPLRVLVCALVAGLAVLPGRAAGGDGEPATFSLTCCRKKCYDPCEPVGPVRRFLRRVFLRPCPPPVVAVAPAPVVLPAAPVPCAPPCAPPVPAPAPPVPAPAPPVPAPPVPSAPFPPGTGSSYRHPPHVLTPPTPPPPIHVERIASVKGDEPAPRKERKQLEATTAVRRITPPPRIQVTLVNAETVRLKQYSAADELGRFSVTLKPGSWLVYKRGDDGLDVYQGQIEVRQEGTTRVQLRMK